VLGTDDVMIGGIIIVGVGVGVGVIGNYIYELYI